MFELKKIEKKTLNGSRSREGGGGGGGVAGEERYLINLLNTFHVQIL